MGRITATTRIRSLPTAGQKEILVSFFSALGVAIAVRRVRQKLPLSKFCEGMALLAIRGSPLGLRLHLDVQFGLATFAFDVALHKTNSR